MNSFNPTISVITVTKNALPALNKTKESLLSQEFEDFEWIVIDGDSSDGTSSELRNINSLNLKFISEPDNGLYEAMNKGIKIANGEIIGILNADDTYLEGTLSLISKVAKDNPNFDIYYGSISIDGRGIHRLSHKDLELRMIYHPSIFVKKAVYEQLGTFNTKYKIAADYDFILRAKKRNYRFFEISQPLTNYQSGGISSKHILLSIIETLIIQLKYPSISNLNNCVVAIKSLGSLLLK